MNVSMDCGFCGSSLALSDETDDEYLDAMVLLANRFANAHANCGYMTPLPEDEQPTHRVREISPRRVGESEEA